jgi:oligopeptide transport system permease protein
MSSTELSKPVTAAAVPATAAPSLHALADSPLTAMRPQRSLWSNALRRLRQNVMAMAALCFLFFLLVVAIFAPAIAPHNPVQTDVAVAGTLRQAAWVDHPSAVKSGTWDYPLGTDSVGRDVFSRLVYGTRVSLVVGLIPMVVIMLIGVPIGLMAGFSGGRLDNLLMRMTDVVYAFPALLLAIVMQIAFGDTGIGRLLNGLVLLFISLSVVSWTGVARLVRGETLSLKEKEFVEAARTSGASKFRLITRHILPNSLGPIIVAGAFIIPGAIISEAILSYLGVGVRPDVNLNAPFPTSWGQMILDGSKTYNSQLWMLLAPSLAVALTTLSFTFVGDGLRDALDPRQSD